MKAFFVAVALLFSAPLFAQCKTFILSPRGDTLNCTDVKGRKQGPWAERLDPLRGEKGYEQEGKYKDNMRTGRWKRFSLQGDKIADEHYRFGQKDGLCVYYNDLGNPIREEKWRAIDPANPYDTVPVYAIDDPTKIEKYVVVKVDGLTVPHGTWKFYNPVNGRIEETQQWRMGKRIEEDDLAPIDVAEGDVASEEGGAKKAAAPAVKKKPAAVLEYEKKNSGKKKVKVRDGSTGG